MAYTLIATMRSTLIFLSLFVFSVTLGAPLERRGQRFPYGTTKVRGVGLGGWLVLENWITPGFFNNLNDKRIVDEYTLGQYLSSSKASSVMKQHWDTFITEDDFKAIAAAGLNHVRIPIGYWALDVSGGEPYRQGSLAYLYKAVTWAQNNGLKVWIGLHGAPGSQNGFSESGRLGAIKWHTSASNIARTKAVIKTLAAEFSKAKYAGVVTAIGPLNEPAGWIGDAMLSKAKQFYLDAYDVIRHPTGTAQQGDLIEVIGDAFQSLDYWNGWQPYPKYSGVIMELHNYQVFIESQLRMNVDQHVQFACQRGQQMTNYANKNIWVVTGEWSVAMTDCAGSKKTNPRGLGARYDGTYPGSTKVGDCKSGKASTFSASYKAGLRKFWEAQVVAYEQTQGWFYWNWKTETVDEWSYKVGLAEGWIPKDPSERIYPNICG